MPVHFHSEDISFTLKNKSAIRNWINHIVVVEDKKVGQINYVFCSDPKILEINKQFLKHYYYTDIISFDYGMADRVGGEIYISIDTVLTNSQKYKTVFYEELRRVIIHGVLHFLGYNDKKPEQKKKMKKAEDKALEIYKKLFHVEPQ